MSTWILTLNAGSSSLKVALFEMQKAGDAIMRLVGQVDGLGVQPHLALKSNAGEIFENVDLDRSEIRDHSTALDLSLAKIRRHVPEARIAAVAHRVVHGGPDLAEPVVVTPDLMARLGELEPLAPLHQPHNLAGIRAAQRAFPDALQVACFDTAFHRRHPWVNDTFALPRRFYDRGVRRYGFHGLSYEYVTRRLREIAPHHAAGRLVVAHLGSGASMCAIRDGQSIGSTMGFSALDGLPMGTRCGQLDPGVLLYLIEHEGMSAKEISNLLYKESGLKGLSGLSNDMRVLEEAGTPEAQQAIDYFVFRVRRELGAMTAILSGIDALVFCGGIGENAWRIREKVCRGLDWLGLEIDEGRNRAGDLVIASDISRVKVFVIRTNEEEMLAEHTRELLCAQTKIATTAAE